MAQFFAWPDQPGVGVLQLFVSLAQRVCSAAIAAAYSRSFPI